ncbi:DUF4064 domain-containing protein [Bacillus sp. AK031]
MSRTAEIVMGMIGILFSVMFAVMGFAINDRFAEVHGAVEREFSRDPSLSGADINYIMEILDSVGPFLLGLGLASTVMAVIAVVLIKGNNKPKVAGIFFILAGLVIGLGTFGAGFLPGLLFLISGIMALARKPKDLAI